MSDVVVEENEEQLEFQSLDGEKVRVKNPNMLRFIRDRGYTRVQPVMGKVGYSELGMHTRACEMRGVVAFLRQHSNSYAYVLLDDGNFLDGCFCLKDGGTFSLS